jgi:hypothetical protein
MLLFFIYYVMFSFCFVYFYFLVFHCTKLLLMFLSRSFITLPPFPSHFPSSSLPLSLSLPLSPLPSLFLLSSSLSLPLSPSQITTVFNFINKNKTVLSRFEDEFFSRKTIDKETQQPVSLSTSYFANNSAGINNCETVVSLMLHFPGFEKMNEALNIIGTALCVREMLFKCLRESELAGRAGCTGSCSDDARLQAKVRTEIAFYSSSTF